MKYLIILLISLTTWTVKADCMDPTDPNCICTNCPDPTNYVASTVYTNGELHLLILNTSTNVFVLLTNGSLLEDYVIERSFDLSTWDAITPKFETDTNGLADAAFPPTNTAAFYRARVATYVEYANIGTASGSFSCGSYIGYANYYGLEGDWGYVFEPNMTRHIAYDGSGKTNRIVSYLGRNGDNGCGTYQVEVIEVGSGKYRFTLFAVSGETVPQTNQPIRLKGMTED